MGETTGRLALPLIEAGQAQKEVAHNEALTLLDLLVQASVVAAGLDAPPAGPLVGQAWIVGSAPTDAWAGRAGQIAGWTEGGWRFVAPREGMALWSEADGGVVRRMGRAWVTRGARQEAITAPSGGTRIDAEARAAIGAILAALRAYGVIAA